jgi:hypothetical protein
MTGTRWLHVLHWFLNRGLSSFAGTQVSPGIPVARRTCGFYPFWVWTLLPWPQPAECHIDSGTGKVRAETRETATLRGLVVAGGYRAGAGGLLQETLQRAEGR